MSMAPPSVFKERPLPQSATGVRLHRFTVDEYHRMAEFGVIQKDDPIELVSGYLFIKLKNGPPYGVPLGIPPEVIAGADAPQLPQRRFTVREYQQLMKSDALHPALRTELIEGWVVEKMVRNAKHDSTLQRVADALQDRLGKNWKLRLQSGAVMDDAELEPDLVIVPGPAGRFDDRHPRPSDIELLAEISNTTIGYDRGLKLRDYARNAISRYWIINITDRQVEEFAEPSGPTDFPEFRIRRVYREGESIPLTVGNEVVVPISVNDLLPGNPSPPTE